MRAAGREGRSEEAIIVHLYPEGRSEATHTRVTHANAMRLKTI